jgi:two-component system chemotaxis response regulator CheB
VIGVILSGANDDGARGMKVIADLGGTCIAQDPDTADSPVKPRSAIELARIETVLPPAGIGELLLRLGRAGVTRGMGCDIEGGAV